MPSGYEQSPDYGGRRRVSLRRVTLLAASVATGIFFAAIFLAPRAKSEDFHGYPCTEDCSGHEAGYDWAGKNDLHDESDCSGDSQSFIEGCQAYTEENPKEESDDQDNNGERSDTDGQSSE